MALNMFKTAGARADYILNKINLEDQILEPTRQTLLGKVKCMSRPTNIEKRH